MLKVSSKTEPKKLAGAILGAMRENGGSVEVQAIGAGAVNQAVKAIAIASSLSENERKIKAVPGFAGAEIQGKQVTVIRFMVFAS
ncbi:MAG: stage V sporulation protein S [Firmicutes bacterium]|nr:stage V sporulation protein S [Bacillota bacterium]